MGSDTTNPLYFFLAGALLPTLAYSFLSKQEQPIKTEELLSRNEDEDNDSYASSEEEEETIARTGGEDPSKWGLMDAPYKMVLCVNMELKMGKGKVAAQCCHAALGCYKRAMKSCPGGVRGWEVSGCAKIAVKCPSEEEMMQEIMVKAAQAGIPYYFVEDAGRTQIAAGSRTVLGLGPAPVRTFEGITSHLKLM
jgi:peptidyl-tRNA hydrolase